MELRHLRYFAAVAEVGSISRAAQVVRVAQPSLSRQLRQLEAEVGEPLLDRSGRRARLTPAGEVFLPLARDLVRRADRAAALMQGLADGYFVIPYTIGGYLSTIVPGEVSATDAAFTDTARAAADRIAGRCRPQAVKKL